MTPQTLFSSRPPYSSWENQGQSRLVAYFSMEIAITPAMPTYSGGLGVLAGDTLRAAADMRLPQALLRVEIFRLVSRFGLCTEGYSTSLRRLHMGIPQSQPDGGNFVLALWMQ